MPSARSLLALSIVALSLSACEPPEEKAYNAARAGATKATQQAMGGDTELRWVVHNQVNGEDIVCAYAAPLETPKGQRPVVTPVIVRGGKTLRAADVGPEAFARMQDQLCGPDWVKARP